jgi:YD repeat-containing protein
MPKCGPTASATWPAPSLGAEVAWKTALAGKPVFDPDVVPVSSAFERIVHNACQLGVTDSGWGYTIPSNILCWEGGTLVKNQNSYREFRRLDFNGLSLGATGCTLPWTETVYAQRGRKIVCPETYGTRLKANGDLECWKLPPECRSPSRWSATRSRCSMAARCSGSWTTDRGPPAASRSSAFTTAVAISDSTPHPSERAMCGARRGIGASLSRRRRARVLAYAQRADGSLLAFAPSGREMQNNQGGGSALLQKVADAAGTTTGWRLTTAEMDVETYDASGRLAAVALRSGKSYALSYADGRLANVTDTFGGTVTFTYDASGRLNGFVAPGNRVYAYGYDPKGRLTSVTYPDNAVRTYHYEDTNFVHALTGITDENGARYATWAYESGGRATLSQHAGGADSVMLYYGSYSSSANDGQTTVVDGFNTTHTYYYQVAGGVVRIRAVSDAAGTRNYGFDANGNTATYRDANGVQTTYTYDLARNLEISRTEAYGTAVARTIATEWHPIFRLPARIAAPSSVAGVTETTDFVYDAQGNLLQKDGHCRRQVATVDHDVLGAWAGVDARRTAHGCVGRPVARLLRRQRQLRGMPRQREDDDECARPCHHLRRLRR